jgi:hypothetical protein
MQPLLHPFGVEDPSEASDKVDRVVVLLNLHKVNQGFDRFLLAEVIMPHVSIDEVILLKPEVEQPLGNRRGSWITVLPPPVHGLAKPIDEEELAWATALDDLPLVLEPFLLAKVAVRLFVWPSLRDLGEVFIVGDKGFSHSYTFTLNVWEVSFPKISIALTMIV